MQPEDIPDEREEEPCVENEYTEPDYSAADNGFTDSGSFTDENSPLMTETSAPGTWDTDAPAAPVTGAKNNRQKAPAGKEKKDYGHGILK